MDRHINAEELNALVPWPSEQGRGEATFSAETSTAAQHVASCVDCRERVSKYRQLVKRLSNLATTGSVPSGPDCPKYNDVDWHEVAAGLWPELKAKQLIMHAAVCDHCGSLLRAAAVVDDAATVGEEALLAQLKAPSRPVLKAIPEPIGSDPGLPSAWKQILRWKMVVPALALTVLVAVLVAPSRKPLSGRSFAEFAVRTHRQHAQGELALEIRSDSQQKINEWFRARSQFPAALPASLAAPGEERPYRLDGARLLQIAGKPAAFIAYEVLTPKLKMLPASLVVAPDSVAVASGGVQADFQKVSFHYATIDGYKVVTWSLHGLTYALVSQESNRTQRSCMVCHSAMGDRDLSEIPTPLPAETTPLIWQ